MYTAPLYVAPYAIHLMEQKIKILHHEFLCSSRTLNIGCGTTDIFYGICGRLLKSYYGVDPDIESPEGKSQSIKNGFYKRDIKEIEKFDFDNIVCFNVIEEVEDVPKFFNNLRQYRHPEGFLLVSIPNIKSINREVGLASGMIDTYNEIGINDIRQGHLQLPSLEETKEWLGLKNIRSVLPVGFKPLNMRDMELIPHYWDKFDKLIENLTTISQYCAEWLIISK